MPVSADVQSLADRIAAEVAAFRRDPPRAREALRDLVSRGPDAFCQAALPLLKQEQGGAGVRFLHALLPDLLPLCNPALCSLEDDVAIARLVMRKDPLLEVKLAKRIGNSQTREGPPIETAVALRILEVIATVADGTRILPILIQCLRQPDPRLRSKAALLIGRTNRSAQGVEKAAWEPDARVRANCVEALWGVDTEAARAALWAATSDPHNRVQGNALLGLYRLGDAASIGPLVRMSAHAEPLFRATAAWAMGETGDPRFLPILTSMVGEPDAIARRHVFRAISRVKRAISGLAQAPPLRVALGQTYCQPDGVRLVRAALSLPGGGEVTELRPTGIVLWQGPRMIAEYTVRGPRSPARLALAVALPALRAFTQPSCVALEQGAQACVALQRQPDRIAIVRFGQTPPEADPGSLQPGASFLGEDVSALDPELEELRKLPSYAQVLRTLLNTLTHVPGASHALLLEDRTATSAMPKLDSAGAQTLIRDARAAKVAVHSVALTDPGGSPGILAEVAAQTGGVCLAASDPEAIPALCEKLSFFLLHSLEVLYCPEDPEPAGPLKLQVYCAQGCGEDVLGG